MKKVSVIMPVYNVEKYLASSIESVLAQTHKNIELIIVDDGSIDTSGDIADSYAALHGSIRVVHIKNGGVSNARNVALNLAMGEYISFIDGDDLIAKDMIESLCSSLEENSVDISVCGLLPFYNTQKIKLNKKTHIYAKRVINAQDALSEMLYQGNISNGVVGKLYRSNLFTGIRFPDNVSIAEDLAVNYDVFSNAKLVAVEGSKKYFYRQHSASAMHCKFTSKKLDALNVVYEIYNSVRIIENHNLLRAAQNRLFIEAINILVKAPDDRQYYHVRFDCEDLIRNYRAFVLSDKKATARFRFYAGLSFMGADKLVVLYNFKYKIISRFSTLTLKNSNNSKEVGIYK
jgi:glycosyltransferase involved in cell wall biosynthesis